MILKLIQFQTANNCLKLSTRSFLIGKKLMQDPML